MIFILIILPLFGFLSGAAFGRVIGNASVNTITTVLTYTSFLYSWYFFCCIICTGNVYILDLGTWISMDSFDVNWAFCIDSLTGVMLCVVTSISTCVHLYSIEYMAEDPHQIRFMSYLSLFTFFMLILVTANNFLQMFIGWEGVGVSSYLLINFWYTRIQANKAAIKAMLMNRVGDFAILLALFLIYFLFNSLNYEVVFTLVPLVIHDFIIIAGMQIPIVDFISTLLFFGAMGKSAQLGLHTWLPDAMEGPTPVSALIHAATMVTAGVFLIARCSYIFEFSSFSLNLITIVGSTTALFAATTGLFQNDIKKVIAYSTCSQLGYMIFACGLSSYEVGLFHLSNHAFFKALLFLGAGSIIHSLGDEQDLRKMGGLRKILPLSYAVTLIGSLALIGFPFLAGFYSKDVILELSISQYSIKGHFAFLLGVLAAFCTAFYSTRVLYLVFLSSSNGVKTIILNAHESSWKIVVPLIFLSICSILVGYTTKDIFIGFGSDFWGPSIFVSPENYILTDVEFLNVNYKLMPLLLTLGGLFFAFFVYNYTIVEYFRIKKNSTFKKFYYFFNKKWFFDRVYTQWITQNVVRLSYDFYYKNVDRGLLEFFGPQGVTVLISATVVRLIKMQSGFMLNYLFSWSFFLGLFFILFILFIS